MREVWGAIALILSVTAGLAAQHHDHPRSPYADEIGREIKALSADEIAGYLDGAGMGFAKAAELNGYPGPRHVLDLSDELALTETQAARVRAVFDSMRARAIELGRGIVDAERQLDRAFAGRSTDAAMLERTTDRIGRLRGQLRWVHLSAHLAMADVLDPDQVRRYQHLRGYAKGDRD